MPPVSEHMAVTLLTVTAATSVEQAARDMDERGVGAVLVLEDSRLEGVLTERDVLRAVARGQIEGAMVGDFMTRNPETLEPGESTEQAAVLMIHGGFRHLPVVDGERVVGIISIRDLMRVALSDSSPRGV